MNKVFNFIYPPQLVNKEQAFLKNPSGRIHKYDYVHYLLIFGRLFIIFFHDSTEAITKLNKEFRAAALLFWHLHKLCDMYWGAEKLDLITLFALGTDLVLAAEELLPFLHQGRHFLAVHGQNNLYESR